MERKAVKRKGGGGVSEHSEAPLETSREVANSDQGQKKGRRVASGTAAAAGEALQQAFEGWPQPPGTLRPSERRFWQQIMIARLPAQWAQVDLLHAVNLARTLADIESNRAKLLREGSMVKSGGALKLNPRAAYLETLNRRAIAQTRFLQLHAVATIGPKGKQQGTKAEAEGAANALNAGSKPSKQAGPFNPDELLATPTRLQ